MYWEEDYTRQEQEPMPVDAGKYEDEIFASKNRLEQVLEKYRIKNAESMRMPDKQKLEEIIDLYISLKEAAAVFHDKISLTIDEKQYLVKVTYWTKELILVDDGNFGIKQMLFELTGKCPICSVKVCEGGILISAEKSFLNIIRDC